MQWFAPPFDLAATVPHTTGTVWVIPIFVLPGSFYLKRGLLHLNFYSWTYSKGKFGNLFSFMGIYIEAYFISEFPRNTYSLAHAVFPLGVPSVLNTVTADV